MSALAGALADAAFGARPDLAVVGVPAEPHERWLAAVVLGGQGRYAAAAALLDPLRTHADPVLAALAGATLAAHRRQLGGHASARRLDAAGHARLAAAGLLAVPPDATAAGPPARAAQARSDVLLGLAADAIGLGRLPEARRLLAAEGDRPARWRAAVRGGWVRVELELSAGRADAALRAAEPAAELAEAAGSVRHRIKSRLVLGAALAAGGTERSRAHEIVTGALDDATDLGLLSLVWPAALILAELDPTHADENCQCAGIALRSVLHRADPVGRRLAERSPWLPRLAGPTG